MCIGIVGVWYVIEYYIIGIVLGGFVCKFVSEWFMCLEVLVLYICYVVWFVFVE